MNIHYTIKSFKELTIEELYAILRLRSEVFLVEQQCIYQDMDNKDQESFHLIGMIDGVLAGYTRLLPAGVSYHEVSIGRVIVHPDYRGLQLGRQLMEKSLEVCNDLFGNTPIRICAQHQLSDFYASLGFTGTSAPYMHEGRLHVEMLKE